MSYLGFDSQLVDQIDLQRFNQSVGQLESLNSDLTAKDQRQLRIIGRRIHVDPPVMQSIDKLSSKSCLPQTEIEKVSVANSKPTSNVQWLESGRSDANKVINSTIGSEGGSQISSQQIRVLLKDQKDLSRKDLEDTMEDRSVLLESVAEMTGILKETMQSLSSTVLEQNMQLDSIHDFASENNTQLATQKKQMAEASKEMKLSLCATFLVEEVHIQSALPG